MHDTISSLLTAGAALAAVLALILAAGRIARQCRTGRFGARRSASNRGASRLAIAETIALDQRRRLHLIRCDGGEFLLLTGGATDLVIRRPNAGEPCMEMPT